MAGSAKSLSALLLSEPSAINGSTARVCSSNESEIPSRRRSTTSESSMVKVPNSMLRATSSSSAPSPRGAMIRIAAPSIRRRSTVRLSCRTHISPAVLLPHLSPHTLLLLHHFCKPSPHLRLGNHTLCLSFLWLMALISKSLGWHRQRQNAIIRGKDRDVGGGGEVRLSREEVDHVAYLARLGLSDEEVERFREQL